MLCQVRENHRRGNRKPRRTASESYGDVPHCLSTQTRRRLPAKGFEVKTILLGLAGLAAIIALTWLVTANDVALTSVFAPRAEQIRRNTFVQSQAYNEGMAQQLADMQAQYIAATPDQKQMLRTVILHRYAGVDVSRLPADSQAFLNQLKDSAQ